MITFKELKERWKSPISDFWRNIQKYCLAILAGIGAAYGSIALLEATGYYKAPAIFLTILEYGATLAIGVGLAAKFTKTDIKPEDVDTDEKKVEAIKEIISVDNKLVE